MLDLSTEQDAVLLPVKIIPGASRTGYIGEWDGRARFAVSAPPEKGKANKAIVVYLAKLLGIRKRDVTIVSGLTSPQKTVRIAQIGEDAVRQALRDPE